MTQETERAQIVRYIRKIAKSPALSTREFYRAMFIADMIEAGQHLKEQDNVD